MSAGKPSAAQVVEIAQAEACSVSGVQATRESLLAQYGADILGEVDFARSRVRPSYSLDASAGVDLYEKESKRVSLQVQGSNLTNHLNVFNFASLFSGTAVAVPRNGSVRVAMVF